MVCLSEKNTEGLSKASAELKTMIDNASFSSLAPKNNLCDDPKYTKYCTMIKVKVLKRNVIQRMIDNKILNENDLLMPPFSPTAKEFLNSSKSSSPGSLPPPPPPSGSKPKIGQLTFAEAAAKIKKQKDEAKIALNAMNKTILNKELNSIWNLKKYKGDKKKWKELGGLEEWKTDWRTKKYPPVSAEAPAPVSAQPPAPKTRRNRRRNRKTRRN